MSAGREMRIMIVDDQALNRKHLEFIIKPLGELEQAENGREALEKFQKAVWNGTPFNLVLLDIMMPEMDGHEALEKIRKFEDKEGVLPESRAKIIMVTSVDDSKMKLATFKSKADKYIEKPIDKDKLLAMIKSLDLY
jgi:two-component system chemotaxis response regulator CheY